jgi:hypothetical protein
MCIDLRHVLQIIMLVINIARAETWLVIIPVHKTSKTTLIIIIFMHNKHFIGCFGINTSVGY